MKASWSKWGRGQKLSCGHRKACIIRTPRKQTRQCYCKQTRRACYHNNQLNTQQCMCMQNVFAGGCGTTCWEKTLPSQVWPGLIRMLQAEGRLSTCFLLKPCAVEAAKHRHSGVSISSFNATQHLWSGRATALLPDKESEHGTNSRTDASHLIGKGSSAADADTRLLVAHDDSTCNLVRTVLR